jgi:hypothetical protein
VGAAAAGGRNDPVSRPGSASAGLKPPVAYTSSFYGGDGRARPHCRFVPLDHPLYARFTNILCTLGTSISERQCDRTLPGRRRRRRSRRRRRRRGERRQHASQRGGAGSRARAGGRPRARSHCRFVLPHIHFIPALRTYSVPQFLKRQCDRTLDRPPRYGAAAALVLVGGDELGHGAGAVLSSPTSPSSGLILTRSPYISPYRFSAAGPFLPQAGCPDAFDAASPFPTTTAAQLRLAVQSQSGRVASCI